MNTSKAGEPINISDEEKALAIALARIRGLEMELAATLLKLTISEGLVQILQGRISSMQEAFLKREAREAKERVLMMEQSFAVAIKGDVGLEGR